ncbi:putative nuclease HARBI1 [Heterodontus francisci]|uniref:putative nuclease HARBI1 n=1 Tax=Heterodontus francisci TaxID=7792 RepID=UPI00355C6D4F
MSQGGTEGQLGRGTCNQLAQCIFVMWEGEQVAEWAGCEHVRRRAYPAGRVYRPRLSYLQLSERQCRRRLQLSRETVTSLCEMLAVGVASNCLGAHPIPVALKMTIALNFYACGSFQASMADLCGVSQAAAHQCRKVVTDALFHRANNFITFKTDNTSQAERARGFGTKSGFPMVQGIIDRTHVAIRAPAGQSGAFINRKGFHSLNVQLVCDHGRKIMQVAALFSPPDRLEGWILGDRGYPLKTWLMTPSRILRGHAEERCNESQAATRVTIEQTIGLLKMSRFLDCSGGALQYTPSRASRIIVVCCALHNLPMEKGEALEDDQGQREASSDEDGVSDEEDGQQSHDDRGEEAECHLELSARETREALIGRCFS